VVRSLAIAIEDLMGLGKPLAIQHQAHDDLLTVRPVIARVSVLGLGIVQALAFEVRRGQIVEVDGVVQVEQRALPRGQGLLDPGALGVQPIQVAIQRLVAEGGEVGLQDIGQGRAPDPVGHRVLRCRAHQAVQRHQLGEQTGPRREAGRGQDRIQCERPPQLMAGVDGTGFADVLEPDLVGVNGHHVVPSGECGARATARRARPGRERLDGGIGHERRLAAQRGGEFVGEAPPLIDGGRCERAERTDRAVARALGGGDGLDEEMIDVRRAAHAPGGALDKHAGLFRYFGSLFVKENRVEN
jgi:hypothetical protein